MKQLLTTAVNFNTKTLLSAALPSYIFPTGMSFLSGYFLQDPDLMHASYITIGLSSLIATLACFTILWQMERHQIFIFNKYIRTLSMLVLMVFIALSVIEITKQQHETFNIILSTVIGTTITGLRQKITKK